MRAAAAVGEKAQQINEQVSCKDEHITSMEKKERGHRLP